MLMLLLNLTNLLIYSGNYKRDNGFMNENEFVSGLNQMRN